VVEGGIVSVREVVVVGRRSRGRKDKGHRVGFGVG
jgi:hypothetical protein